MRWNLIIWLIMLTPLALVAVLFALSPRHGVLGLEIVVGTAVLYFAVGFLGSRVRGVCPSCRAWKLKRIMWFRVNPPPNYAFYRCDECGKEYAQVDGQAKIERGESQFKDHSGWDTD